MVGRPLIRISKLRLPFFRRYEPIEGLALLRSELGFGEFLDDSASLSGRRDQSVAQKTEQGSRCSYYRDAATFLFLHLLTS